MNLHCRQNECLRFETANGNHSTIKLLQRKICRKFVENLPPLQRSSPTFLLQASINTNTYIHTHAHRHTDTLIPNFDLHKYSCRRAVQSSIQLTPFMNSWIAFELLDCLRLQIFLTSIYIKLLVCRFVCTTYRNVRFIRCCVSIKYVCRYWCCLQVYFLGAINACWHWLRLSLWFRVGSLQHVF